MVFKYGTVQTTLSTKNQVKTRGGKILAATIIDTWLRMEHNLSGYVINILQNGDIEYPNVTSTVVHNDSNSSPLQQTRAAQVSVPNATGQDCEGN